MSKEHLPKNESNDQLFLFQKEQLAELLAEMDVSNTFYHKVPYMCDGIRMTFMMDYLKLRMAGNYHKDAMAIAQYQAECNMKKLSDGNYGN